MACGGVPEAVNCRVEVSSNTLVLRYTVGDDVQEKNVTWDWVREEDKCVAKMEAKVNDGTIRYHKSNAIDADIVNSLGKHSTSLVGSFYMVTFKKPPGLHDLHEFF